jgi:hypothetical protein
MDTSTPEGIVIGAFPIRDMVSSSRSPHETEHFTTDLALTRFTVGHEALAGGQDGDTQTTENSGKGL